MTTSRHTWAIGAIDRIAPHVSGSAPTPAEAWLEALAGARAALLAGELDSLAVAIDGELEALYTPSHDSSGAFDQAEITETLLCWYQDVAAPAVVARLQAQARRL